MTRRALSSLGKMVREKRGDEKLRETAKVIGISAATLLRIENGRIPDVATFGKICHWLGIDPGDFLGFDVKTSALAFNASQPVMVSAHFKGDATPDPETANAVGKMILFAMKMQPSKTILDNGDL